MSDEGRDKSQRARERAEGEFCRHSDTARAIAQKSCQGLVETALAWVDVWSSVVSRAISQVGIRTVWRDVH
jgi:hypothetical protein